MGINNEVVYDLNTKIIKNIEVHKLISVSVIKISRNYLKFIEKTSIRTKPKSFSSEIARMLFSRYNDWRLYAVFRFLLLQIAWHVFAYVQKLPNMAYRLCIRLVWINCSVIWNLQKVNNIHISCTYIVRQFFSPTFWGIYLWFWMDFVLFLRKMLIHIKNICRFV